jgi:hypothetical protein
MRGSSAQRLGPEIGIRLHVERAQHILREFENPFEVRKSLLKRAMELRLPLRDLGQDALLGFSVETAQ